MGERFSEKANFSAHVGYDLDSAALTFEQMIAGGEPFFVGESGMIGALTFEHPFNRSHKAAQELFWWSEKREGLLLLAALTEHCEKYCDSLTMVTLEAIEPRRMGELYEKLGFAPLERSFVKVF